MARRLTIAREAGPLVVHDMPGPSLGPGEASTAAARLDLAWQDFERRECGAGRPPKRADLARAMGASRSALSNALNSHYSFGPDKLKRAAKYLGVDPRWLVDGVASFAPVDVRADIADMERARHYLRFIHFVLDHECISVKKVESSLSFSSAMMIALGVPHSSIPASRWVAEAKRLAKGLQDQQLAKALATPPSNFETSYNRLCKAYAKPRRFVLSGYALAVLEQLLTKKGLFAYEEGKEPIPESIIAELANLGESPLLKE